MARRVMPAHVRRLVCVAVACLLAASSVAVVSAAAGGQESDSGAVVRIVARKVADGRVEFGLQQRQGDASWGERMLPPRRFFPTTATVGRWLASSPLTARLPQAAAQPTETTGRDVLVGLLAALGTAAENSAGYDRSDYDHSSGELCDTSGTDPYTGLTFTAATCDVDHIVAAKEAHESGGHRWDSATRGRFGDDRLNLVASRDCVNRSKGSSDLAEWSGVQSGACAGARLTTAGRCFWAARTVAVKYRYNLTVDTAERAALGTALNQCPADIDAAAPSRATVTTAPTPDTPSSTTTASDCHPAYDPCLPNLPGDALNCSDLTAAQKPVRVKQIGIDPYRLDRDRNGWGCTS